MTTKDLFSKIEEILQKITFALDEEERILGKKYENKQLRSDVQRGWVKHAGIMIPLDLINHKILYDSYEYHLIETFLTFFKKLNQERSNIFTEFSFRTLVELSFYRIQIFFSDKVSDKEKNKFKLLIWLADYSSMGITDSEHKKSYEKLLSEFGGLLDLTKEYYKPLLDMKVVLENKDVEKHADLVEEIRRMISPIQGDLYSKTIPLPLFEKKKIKPIYSSFSHILHGNTLLIHNLLTNKLKPSQHKLRVHWFMLMCGVNVIAHVAYYLRNDELIEKVEKIIKETDGIMKIISQNWKIIEVQPIS